MTARTLILRSLRFHARSHLGAFLGATVGSAVLIGALVVGDSVRGSLREMALARLGQVRLALAGNDRFFRAALAEDLERQWAPGGRVVAAISASGTANTPDDSARANRVQVVGVDERFWLLSESRPSFKTPSDAEVVVSASLASQLKVKPGDSIVLRVARSDLLSRETPIVPQGGSSISLRREVSAIATDAEFGRFSLQASQVAPFNAFVSLSTLQAQLKRPGGANLLLANVADDAAAPSRADNALRQAWQLADAGLELRELRAANALELRTSRVFLDPPVGEAALKAATNATGILTYFVNELRAGDRATPYSMVAAMGGPVVPGEMRDDEILVNQWLADDLQARPGDALSLSYYVVGLSRRLEERTNRFTIRAVLPLTGYAADRTLMPDFPGLEQAESTRDWDASLPIKLDRIRPRDEEYWKQYRGTPKAFITLAAGQKLWANRFGDLTAVRYPTGAHLFSRGIRAREALDLSPGSERKPNDPDRQVPDATRGAAMPDPFRELIPKIERALLSKVEPASVGLRFEPVRQQALAAAEQSQDFGGLFLGFSFFLIVAALLLMALLFQFGIERRATEIGTLLAVGFTPKQVRRLLLFEGGALALAGGMVGAIGGLWYARAMLLALSTVWREAVQTSALRFHAEAQTLAVGTLAAVLVAWLTIGLALRKQARCPARELLAEGTLEQFQVEPAALNPPPPEFQARSSALQFLGSRFRRRNAGTIGAGVAGLGALALVGWAAWRGDTSDSETFFTAGALFLIAGLSACSALLTGMAAPRATSKITLSTLGLRNCARRRRRSLATLGLLACGSFLIASIGVFRLDAVKDSAKRGSGTGGFALIGETSLPVVQDLNSKAGREFFGLDDKALAGVAFVPFRVREGDDASCLNLNRAQRPRLLGVKPEWLADRKAFTFVKTLRDVSPRNPWLLLDPFVHAEVGVVGSIKTPSIIDDTVPAIGDEASIVWAMGKKVGDTLDYTDERGRAFKVRIVGAVANSVLQGNLVIAEEEFVRRFPSESGYRFWLIDAPSNALNPISQTLSVAMRDVGLELTPASKRLAAFNAVQNTYLSTFQVLGGLGLLLGSAGLGVVVMRNVLERRGELALLLAVGFRPRALQWLVMSEHGALLAAGLVVGLVAAFTAVLPALLSPGATVPYASLTQTLAAVLVSGAVWTWLATTLALRARFLDALRDE